MSPRALVVGCSDGIGLALVRLLLAEGWAVVGASRSASPVAHAAYEHHVLDVAAPDYRAALATAAAAPLDACVYCAGIGAELDLAALARQAEVFAVNLLGAVATAEVVLPSMLAAGRGRLVVLSSQADELVSAAAPSYAASKAGLSSYFEGLGLALRPRGVVVTNVRLGFVATKMARSRRLPFLLTAEEAAGLVRRRALAGRRLRVTAPWRMALVVAALRWLGRWRVRLAR